MNCVLKRYEQVNNLAMYFSMVFAGILLLTIAGCTPWIDREADATATPVVEPVKLIGDVFQQLKAERACRDLIVDPFDCMNAYIRFSGGDDPVAICVHRGGSSFTLPDAEPDWKVGSPCSLNGTITAIVGGS